MLPRARVRARARASSPEPESQSQPQPDQVPKPSPSPSRSKKPHKPHKKPPGTTVTGPDCGTRPSNRPFANRSTVTVSQTTNLVNEVVHVSWTGFTPSSEVLYDQTATDYPVMVVECNSTHPRFWKQCYGANNGGVQGAFGPFGPMNTAYATTAGNGTGELDIQILTVAENQFLGCGVRHQCSLVIVPAQGGNTLSSPVNCHDHSIDTGGTDLGQFAFSSQTGSCSWNDRIIVPLSVRPGPDQLRDQERRFTAIGSPMLLRAMDQWRAGLCASSSPLASPSTPRSPSRRRSPTSRAASATSRSPPGRAPRSWPAARPTPTRRSRSRRWRSPTGSTTR